MVAKSYGPARCWTRAGLLDAEARHLLPQHIYEEALLPFECTAKQWEPVVSPQCWPTAADSADALLVRASSITSATPDLRESIMEYLNAIEASGTTQEQDGVPSPAEYDYGALFRTIVFMSSNSRRIAEMNQENSKSSTQCVSCTAGGLRPGDLAVAECLASQLYSSAESCFQDPLNTLGSSHGSSQRQGHPPKCGLHKIPRLIGLAMKKEFSRSQPATMGAESPDLQLSRLFVGNIGWWVDEDMLRQIFEKFGAVIDIQVMWNTKALQRNRRVNREFAFISFGRPGDALRAIHWLNGCNIEGLSKDTRGLTVQYECHSRHGSGKALQ